MALSEMEVYGPPDAGPEDRVPPQDVAAEQSALGSMMLSKDAIAECSELVRAVDFYRPAHETIFEACVDLYSRGEPVDAITVGDELTKRGDLQRVGGTAYLHQLIASVPTAANAAFYAEIVAERAVLRRLVEAGTRIVQIGYTGGDVEDIVNAAQAEVYAVADKRGGDDYRALAELIEPTLDEIEHAAGSSGDMTGVPTGFTDLDELTNGLHPGQMVIVAARPAVGKALALGTPLPTPTGWTTMGQVAVGEQLLGADGRPTTVVAATEVRHGRPCFEVEFSDGSVIVADEEHLWQVGVDGGEPVVVTTGLLRERWLTGALVTVERPAGVLAGETWKIEEVRPVATVPVRCLMVAAADHLFLAGRAMIPTHNSTFALDVARAAAIKNQLPTVVFSLEMSRTEITMRLLSAESEIPLQSMRKGTMRDRDWTRLAETQGRITDAPLFIDDSPNMSLMEIRAKCRRLKQRHNLKLVIVDYLQLMTSGKRVESRQQEVAEFSRALKLLAKELEVPLIALSQLNRGPEQRTDKKPQMSDLRESGCLTADTRVLRADTGAEVSLGELYETGATDVPVWSLDESLRYVRRHLTHVFPTGIRPVFRLTLRSGKAVRATENHPFLTYDGWRQLGDLRRDDRVAVARHVPTPEMHEPWDDDVDVLRLAADLTSGAVASMPESAWHMSKRQIGLLVASLWQRSGSVRCAVEGTVAVELRGARAVLDQVSRQLLRFGISTQVRAGVEGCVVSVVEREDQRRFLQEVAPHADLGPDVGRAVSTVRSGAARDRPRQVLADPAPLWQELGRVLSEQTDRGSLATVVDTLDQADLDLAAVNDVLFEEVESVELEGIEQVYDATVVGGHNFVADGIAVHNSIEQDADVVILLHRESLYERESPREGEADVIVAKHRNGPTDTVVVAFQGHYSKFTNMASNF